MIIPDVSFSSAITLSKQKSVSDVALAEHSSFLRDYRPICIAIIHVTESENCTGKHWTASSCDRVGLRSTE